MSDPFKDILDRTRAWFRLGREDGWLTGDDFARLDAVEGGTPGDLFADEQMRPLVVALFGGTGVGKSSLLNRLAGEQIARTSVERPTSREVTVYVHEEIELAELPDTLPLDAVTVQRHRSSAWRQVMWIDAPDIDSVEQHNRQRALSWLPHIDLVCYVVSPERYRDDVGWQVLRERGQRHGWMFVMNRCDEGADAQREDFARMLRTAGFNDPVLLPTSCKPGGAPCDRFDDVAAHLRELLQGHGVKELTRLGHRARISHLRRVVQETLPRYGDESIWDQTTRQLAGQWDAVADTILEGSEWSMRALAGRFADRDPRLWQQLQQQARSAVLGTKPKDPAEKESVSAGELDELTAAMWDDWAQNKLRGALDGAEIALRRAGLTGEPVRARLAVLEEQAGQQIVEELRDAVRAALARPGSTLRRAARRGTGFLTAFLPLTALLCVAWVVVMEYTKVMRGGVLSRGVDLAVLSVLFVGICWAVPFTLDRWLKPSLERAALEALRRGLRLGLDAISDEIQTTLDDVRQTAENRRIKGEALLKDLGGLLVKPIDTRSPAVARVLMRGERREAS